MENSEEINERILATDSKIKEAQAGKIIQNTLLYCNITIKYLRYCKIPSETTGI